jgi:AcrR family transcriptional regulator
MLIDAPRVGRPAAATREQVLDVAMRSFLHGERIDVQAIATELGLGRSTIYRWFGTREDLAAVVLNAAYDSLLERAVGHGRRRGGPGLLDAFDALNRSLSGAPALRSFVAMEGIRLIVEGPVHRHSVRRIVEVIEAEVAAGTYVPTVDPETLGYAIVRLAEAFLFHDIESDLERLRALEAALLGVAA